ncbi:triple tyrosine motif-containing protein [Flavobacterium acetivorans]|uniref:triple tyrosine motif-containing protein n=1 Tax=Flavobacterium acetivorans TaxID=2893883 RepID=UPI001E4D1CF9|nr:triple tyrosine motif-containing protein [Flavobacterium sp. F-29]UFH35873.1 LuxR C-terminal-related transcriptional regulator [Flavobacterium sp. F-29]
MTLKKLILYFSFLLIPLPTLVCQVKNIGLPEVRNYKRTDYKGEPQNWNIDQDKNGNLYFANGKGLLQFDGSTWRKYTLPNSGLIRSFKIDKTGKIFVGSYSEFGYFKPDSKGKLNYYSLSKLIKKTPTKIIDIIWKIHIHKESVIFQSFARAYILRNNKLEILDAPNRFQFSFHVDDRIYFQDIEKGILEYKNGNLYPLPGTTLLNNSEIWGILPLPDNKLLITTLEKGLFLYDFKKIIPWNTDANTFIKKNSSLGGTVIKDKFIVLNSVLNGVIICDTKGKIVQHINHKKGLQNNTVLSSFVDSKNNLWLGLDNGIAFLNENSPFTYFGFSYDISTVYASVIHKGNLYVATNRGLFYHSWHTPFMEKNFELVEGTIGQTWGIRVIDNELLCANNRGALVIEGGKAVKTLDNKGYLDFKKIPNLSNYMIASNYNGYAVFKKTSNGWQYQNQIKGFDKSSNNFELDSSTLWFKKDELVYQMILSSDLKKFESIKTHQNISNDVKGIGSIQRIKNTVYFQTDNHFYKYSKEQESFFLDKKMSLLFKNIPRINSLTEDTYGNYWYIFNESLGALMKHENGSYRNVVAPFFNLTGNLVHNYTSINAIDPKNIFIGLTDGLAHYDSTLPNNFVTKPNAFIRSFHFTGEELILENGQSKIEKYKIPYASNHVKFTFSSPTYENLENVEFSYKLEGFDEAWSNWSTVSMKEYTYLKEGDYKMKVKVRNSYGIQSEETTVAFTISPPWYRHFLAYILYFFIVVASIYFIRERIKIKIRKNKYYETLEQRRLYLEKESKIRQEQYDLEKEIEKLKNDKLQIKILAKDKELVSSSLQVAKKNKIFNGIINNLKEINTDSFDENTKFKFTKLNKSIVKEVNTDKSWKDLEKHIKNVHFDFLKRLKEKYPTISPREMDLSTYLLMNMSTKEIAEIMNISSGGVELARYRLRKKLELNKKENLVGFLMSI